MPSGREGSPCSRALWWGSATRAAPAACDPPRPTPLSGSLTEADADVRFYAEGEGLFGADAASVGDTNHDGLDDIAVSASQYGLGVVYIPWTNPTATTVMMVDAEVKIRADVRRGFGDYVHDLGDLNMDGEIDLGVAEMKYPIQRCDDLLGAL